MIQDLYSEFDEHDPDGELGGEGYHIDNHEDDIDVDNLDKYPYYISAAIDAKKIMQELGDDLWFHVMIMQAPAMYHLLEFLEGMAGAALKSGSTTVHFDAKKLEDEISSIILYIIMVEYWNGTRSRDE